MHGITIDVCKSINKTKAKTHLKRHAYIKTNTYTVYKKKYEIFVESFSFQSVGCPATPIVSWRPLPTYLLEPQWHEQCTFHWSSKLVSRMTAFTMRSDTSKTAFAIVLARSHAKVVSLIWVCDLQEDAAGYPQISSSPGTSNARASINTSKNRQNIRPILCTRRF